MDNFLKDHDLLQFYHPNFLKVAKALGRVN